MLSILLAVFAYSLIDIGKTVQKIGIQTWKSDRVKGGIIWTSGILAGTVSSFLILWALSLGSVIIIGSLAGVGMVAMVITARIVLKETPSPLQLVAIAAIIAGPVFMAGASQYSITTQYNGTALWIFIVVLILPGIVFTILLRKSKWQGLLLAITGGILSGLVIVFQKISSSPIGQAAAIQVRVSSELPDFIRTVVNVLLNPYAAAWIFLSILSTIILQLAHRIVQAIRSIPLFNAGVILTPILAGVFVFSEQLRPVQWAGVASILIGITVLIVKPPKRVKNVPSTPKEQ